jgi:hypothetical protein
MFEGRNAVANVLDRRALAEMRVLELPAEIR